MTSSSQRHVSEQILSTSLSTSVVWYRTFRMRTDDSSGNCRRKQCKLQRNTTETNHPQQHLIDLSIVIFLGGLSVSSIQADQLKVEPGINNQVCLQARVSKFPWQPSRHLRFWVPGQQDLILWYVPCRPSLVTEEYSLDRQDYQTMIFFLGIFFLGLQCLYAIFHSVTWRSLNLFHPSYRSVVVITHHSYKSISLLPS